MSNRGSITRGESHGKRFEIYVDRALLRMHLGGQMRPLFKIARVAL
jgi:ribosome maturation protein Sdo1